MVIEYDLSAILTSICSDPGPSTLGLTHVEQYIEIGICQTDIPLTFFSAIPSNTQEPVEGGRIGNRGDDKSLFHWFTTIRTIRYLLHDSEYMDNQNKKTK